MKRLIVFVFALVFLRPAIASEDIENCRSWAGWYRQVAKWRDEKTDASKVVAGLLDNWDKLPLGSHPRYLDAIVVAYHKNPEATPKEIYDAVIEDCFRSKGITLSAL